jgi:hypothetical protein
MADFGYDISDHCDIDPLFGTLQDAQELINEAHGRNIKVLFDVVLSQNQRPASLVPEVAQKPQQPVPRLVCVARRSHPGTRGGRALRLDSINRLGKDPDRRDNMPGLPLRRQDWPSLHPRLRRVRRVLVEYPGRLAVGEVWLFEQQPAGLLVDDRLAPAFDHEKALRSVTAEVRTVHLFSLVCLLWPGLGGRARAPLQRARA